MIHSTRRTNLGVLAAISLPFAFSSASGQTSQSAGAPPTAAPLSAGPGLYWFKGNTHTHTWWSDGDSPPEVAVKWYREHGYNFLSLSDHNKLSEGEKWVRPNNKQAASVSAYVKTFGSDWIVSREQEGGTEFRLKTLRELRERFEVRDQFLMIQGEEISGAFEQRPVHVNAINVETVIPDQKGTSVQDCIQKDLEAVREQRVKIGRPMLAHVNHPNFKWALTIEDMAPIREQNLFEVFNGHTGVENYGDKDRPSVERMWDVILTKRLAELKLPVMYGVGTDDAHCYTRWGTGNTNPGRGWVVVRAARLAPNDIVTAMERGDFYVSTGIVLKDFHFKNDELVVEIDGRPGVTYTTQFIGTVEGYDPKPANRYTDPRGFLVNKYSPTIGQVLSEVPGTRAAYKLTGKEIYVRAKITSTAKPENPYKEGDFEIAFVQPVVPTHRAALPQP